MCHVPCPEVGSPQAEGDTVLLNDVTKDPRPFCLLQNWLHLKAGPQEQSGLRAIRGRDRDWVGTHSPAVSP